MKQKVAFIPFPVWMGPLDATLLQSYKKIFFTKDLFVLALNKCFVTPERLYFSMPSSKNKSAFFLKKESEVNIIYKLHKNSSENFCKPPVVEC